MTTRSLATVTLSSLAFAAMASQDSNVQIRLADPLDEPEFYCLDVTGWGDKLKLDDPMQAHTCKVEDGSDQLFSIRESGIGVGDTGRCLEAAGTRTPLAGTAILARTCNDSRMQAFSLGDNGRISVTGTGLCVTVGEHSAEAFGPSHLWRALTLERCDMADPERLTWTIGLDR